MEDLRIRMTRSMLKNSLLELLEKKPLDEITVTELCREAGVNRTTFYKYYSVPQDVLGEIAEEFFGNLEKYLSDSRIPDVDGLKSALDYLDEQRKVFTVLVNTIPDQIFMDRLFAVPSGIEYYVDEIRPDTDIEYVKLFLFQGGYAVIRRWLNSDRPEPAEEIAQLIEALWERLSMNRRRTGAAAGEK